MGHKGTGIAKTWEFSSNARSYKEKVERNSDSKSSTFIYSDDTMKEL